MPVGLVSFGGSPYLGVYARVQENLAVIPPQSTAAFVRTLERVLGVKVVRTTIAESDVVGSMIAMNSQVILVPEGLDPEERRVLEEHARVVALRGRLNALGNDLLANDQGAVVHPEFSVAQKEAIKEALGVPVIGATIAGLGTVGKAGVVTKNGVVVHPRATEAEIKVLEQALGVPAHRSTANFGIPLVGASVLANSKGLLAGDLTTPVEIVHLQAGLKVFD